MDVNGLGGSPYLQGMQNTQRMAGGQGVNPRQMADNAMASKQLPMQVAEVAGRAATEAKGLFVDTYA